MWTKIDQNQQEEKLIKLLIESALRERKGEQNEKREKQQEYVERVRTSFTDCSVRGKPFLILLRFPPVYKSFREKRNFLQVLPPERSPLVQSTRRS